MVSRLRVQAMGEKEKIEIAKALERMGVDIIEAGFPIASKGGLFNLLKKLRKRS